MENRERMLEDICSDDHRVQYDGNDENRIENIARGFAEAGVAMIEALGNYRNYLNAPISDTSADDMKAARYEVAYHFAMAQAATSKIAWSLRIDGDEAYKRVLANPEDPDLSDL